MTQRIFSLSSLTLVLTFGLSGCTAIFGDSMRDRAMDYQHAQVSEPMLQPAGQQLQLVPAMPIPEIKLTNAEKQKVAQPQLEQEEESEFEAPRPFALVDTGSDAEEVTSLNAYLANDLNPRVELDGNGSQVLRLDGQFTVAWAAVSDALAASQYKLVDLNRSTGTYYIDMTAAQEPEESGFWGWLFGADEPEKVTYLLKMHRSRLGVYLSLQSTVDDLAETEINLQVLTALQVELERRSK